MARAGMLHRGGKNGADGGDDVQRSLELLDKVLSEFDEGEPRSLDSQAPLDSQTPHTPHTPATPDDDSPSLTGHQSEDDGYMSMNGRRAKFALGFRPTEERQEREESDTTSRDTPLSPPRPALPGPPPVDTTPRSPHSPPPPEEAERIISTLLPKVSPANSAKRNVPMLEQQRPPERETLDSIISVNGITTATQTTLPKTRHQRPYGWEKGNETPGFQLQPPPVPPCRFASLPYGSRPAQDNGCLPNWLPPRHQIIVDNTNNLNKRSPSLDSQPVFPFVVISSEKPYNEHPVTIYPGPTKQFNKVHSPTYVLQRVPPFNPKKNVKPDERIEAALSPSRKIPPRTLAGSMERHREVCRNSLEDNIGDCVKRSSKNNDEEHFSDDSLEESFPPPPPAPAVTTPSKRNSIAWEVSLDDDPLLTPGSTKVIGRRRRKSGDNSHSSTSSIPQRVEDCDWVTEEYWPPPPATCSTEDELVSPFSDTESDNLNIPTDINTTGTYVIRKGKNRKQLPAFAKKEKSTKPIKNQTRSLNRSLDTDKSIDGSSISISGSGISSSHNSVSSYSSRPSSESISQSRYSTDLNSRISRELNTPNSRYSIDLCTPNSRMLKEITSPKSRLSLDLNNGQDRHPAHEFLNHSPKNFKDKSNPFVKSAHVPNKLSPQNRFTDFKKYSSTFDNIKSLMKEGLEDCEPSKFTETVTELATATPNMVRVVSLPSLANENESSSNSASRQALITTVEEEEDQECAEPNSSAEASPLRKIENNISAILSHGRDQKLFTPYMPKDWNIHKDEYCEETPDIEKSLRYSSRERQRRQDIQKSSSHNEIQNRSVDRKRSSSRRSSSMHKSTSVKDNLIRQPSSSDSAVSSSGDFTVNVQIVEHSYRSHPLPPSPNMGLDLGPLPLTPESPKFPPLPPSPVQEVEDEYSEILQPRHGSKADTLPVLTADLSRHRSSEPPAVPPHQHSTNSLKTRSMEAGYSKNKRSGHFKSGSTDRRTLPTDMAASGVRRRTLQRQSRDATPPGGRNLTPLQTSASLPETPIFARGCDVPRTPLRQTLGPRQSSTMNSIQTCGGSSTLGGYGRGSVVGTGTGVERALAGAELLRLAGGPARGWYPRQRHRPASIEHLDRLTSSKSASEHQVPWDGTASRKTLSTTLPPNLTPKFFNKSPREALRRVTSLLIRKGNNGKEKEPPKGKETSPAARSANGEDHPGQKQRKGFFKNLWKRSRHYSLEQP